MVVKFTREQWVWIKMIRNPLGCNINQVNKWRRERRAILMLPNTSCSSCWTFRCTSGWVPSRCRAQFMAAAVVSWPWKRKHAFAVVIFFFSFLKITYWSHHRPQTWKCPLPLGCPDGSACCRLHPWFSGAYPEKPVASSCRGQSRCLIQCRTCFQTFPLSPAHRCC